MPTQAPHPCPHPGCRTLTTTSRCTDHTDQPTPKQLYDQTRRITDPALLASKRFRSSVKWTDFSKWFRAQHPLCADPFGNHLNRPSLTQAVHHVAPLHLRPDLALTQSNCRPLCHACHNMIEAMERRGEPTAHLLPALGGGSKV